MSMFPKKLTEREIAELELIFGIDIPHVHISTSCKKHFMGSMHFLHVKNGDDEQIFEASGYARRLLLTVKGGVFTAENTVSPMLYGVFQFLQDVTNKLENHPLIKDAVGRALWEAKPYQCFYCSHRDKEETEEQ